MSRYLIILKMWYEFGMMILAIHCVITATSELTTLDIALMPLLYMAARTDIELAVISSSIILLYVYCIKRTANRH